MTKELDKFKIINKYKDVCSRILRLNFPVLSEYEINEVLDYSLNKRIKNEKAIINNNYKNINLDTTILELSEYIYSRQPIITSRGVMFSRHDSNIINPISNMLANFMAERDEYKDEMFKYSKGSELFEKYNLFQLLSKLDSNALYGAIGQSSCIYFNIHVASSITTQGRSCISAAGLQFEMFLNNNVDFASLTEIVTFIDNVVNDKYKYDCSMFIDRDITICECCYKLMSTCGFGYIPTKEDIDNVMIILSNVGQENINRLYYKNNLFEFMNNKVMQNCIINILSKLETPYINPNKVPKEISVELNEFINILKEFVYYPFQIIDRIGKFSNMMRSNVATTDTDSCIISLDGWYRYVLSKIENIDMKVKHMHIDNIVKFIEKDEFGDFIEKQKLCTFNDNPLDYDFYNDEIIELERTINLFSFIPQDSLRYSIINIMAYALTIIVNDYMYKYCCASNSMDDTHTKCLIYLNFRAVL